MSRSNLLFAAALATAILTPRALALPIFTIAPGQCYTNAAACDATNNIVWTHALGPVLITPTDPLFSNFSSAFDSWNNSLPKAGQWTLEEGGDLSNQAKLTVITFQAYAGTPTCDAVNFGCVEIQIDYTPGPTDPPSIIDPNHIGDADAVWTQSINTNMKLNPSLPGNPYLDNNSPGKRKLDPPAYPYQYTGSDFYDLPNRPATTTWIGEAFITTANYTTRELDVYDGVAWGFTVTAPEPATWAMFGLGGLGLLFYSRRRRSN